MSTVIANPTLAKRRFGVWDTTVGKKAAMALSGAILFGFVIGHLAGNLQVFLGREVLNHYAEFLHSKPGLLWVARAVLILAVGIHIVAAVQLWLTKRAARPQGYATKRHYQQASVASRTMYYTGPLLLFFIVFHLLHFTFGTVHPAYDPYDVYGNVVRGFQVIPTSVFYILSMIGLGLHLMHGAWSMFQSLGQDRPQWTGALHAFAYAAAALLCFGNISIPAAVLAGYLRA